MYSNPNDLAFAIALTLPLCFAFLLSTRSIPRKAAWAISMLAMCVCLFMTSSRAGFIDLLVTGTVCLWIFGIKGRRLHIVVAAIVVVIVVGVAAGGQLRSRFLAISGKNISNEVDLSAHDSYEERRFLMVQSMQAVAHYPWGLGLGDFAVYSGLWRDVHVSYLQIAVEGGIASLVLYLLYFARGFRNLKKLRRKPTYDPDVELFSGALYTILLGFMVGAFFAPEAYQYFPYFAVSYTSVLLMMEQEMEQANSESPHASAWSQSPRSRLKKSGYRGMAGMHAGPPIGAEFQKKRSMPPTKTTGPNRSI
jgi:O-antigen ligase